MKYKHPHFRPLLLAVVVLGCGFVAQAQPVPEFTQQPQSQFVQPGSNAVFQATAIGQEPLTYKWWRRVPPSTDWVSLFDGGRISGAETPTLTISGAQLSDQADYQLLVYDRQSDYTPSDLVTLTIVYPPAITLHPTNRTVLLGEITQFKSSATGTGPMTYRWQLNGADIPGIEQVTGPATFTLTYSNAQPEGAGDYRMVVTNAYGSAVSSNATLVVVDAPMIRTHPSDTASSIGGIALFIAEAIGPGPLSYQWQKDGVSLTPSGRITDVTGPALYISNVQVSDAGNYRLVVSNVHGVTLTREANLRVVPLRAWGDNNHGAVPVPLTITNPVAIAAGVDHTVVLQADGTVFTWGFPVSPPVGLTNAVAIAAGDYHGLALRDDGTVAAWGANGSGESTVPAGLSNVVAIAAGAGHSLALRSDGSVVGWGSNGAYGGGTCNQANPPADLTDVVSIAAGIEYSLALKGDGTVVGWGCNSLGRASPPVGLSNVIAIDAEWTHSLALKNDGTVVAWGDNSFEQTNTPHGLSDVISIAGGNVHSLALKRDGTVVSWGSDYFGPITPPADLSNVVAIAGGEAHSVALVESPATQVPPTILWHPPDRSVPVGQTRVLRPSVHGAWPMQSQWYFNEVPLVGETNTWLVLTSLQTNDSGGYRLHVTNHYGMAASASAMLTVLIPPALTQQPASQTKTRGESVTFSATVSGSTPMSYQWYFENAPLADDEHVSGATSNVLSISNLQTDDLGDYWLVASNAVGVVTSTEAFLEVLGEPRITLQPAGHYALIGRDTSITVSAVGVLPMGYQWYFDGIPLSDDGRVSGTMSPTLALESVVATDAGDYRVVVSNSWGSVTSVVATVAVAHVRHVNVNNPTPAAPYTNWATAATVVQHAIDAASAGDEVLVTNGVYSTGINWQGIPGYSAHRVSINKAIRVISVNGPEVTTIYGNTYPRASTGMRPVYLTNGAFLSGFTLTGGDVDVGSTDSQNQRGGGVLCQSPSAVVSNCIISGNRAGRLGGGAYSGTLVDCRITGNLVRDLAGARTGSGGGAYQSVLNRCQISNNSARYSGGGAHGSTMTNCLLVNNSAVWGGGASGSTLVNCTVTANTSLDDGGLGGAGGGGMAGGSALNSIVVANSGSYGTPNIASVSLSYCCTGSNPGGTGNIVADPRFVDPAGGNYRLQPDSPCINAGVNAANASVADLDARPRVVDSVVDMGAFEAQELPWVVGGPASQSVLLNSNVLFTIVAVGREPLAFQWQKGEVNLTDDGRVSGANSTALAISNLVTQDDDDYRIIVSNALGMCTSSVASLTILLPPTLVAQPDDQFISVGTTATFSILASGIPSLSYQWRRNGTNLANGGKISGVTAPVLLVSNVTTNEEAAYDVVVSNPYGAVTSAPALLSLLPLTIVTQPLTQSVPAGTNVSLAVEAVGPYPVAYQWRFGEVAIPDKTNAALSFTNIQSAQSGSYDVVVMDPFTTLTTSVATVTVVPSAPWFTLQPQSRGVTSGETLALVASANGTEPISYQWQREGTNLVGQAGATLTLTNMDSRMGGCYRVIASNEVGVTASAEAQVSVIQIRVWGWDNLPLQNVPASATNLVQISVSQLPKGPDHMVALRADGTVVAWRSDGSPAEPSGEATNAVKVAAGTSHALALRADRTVVAWGSGSGGPPVPPAATNVVEIAVGESWSAAVRADGKVVGWGGGRILPPPSSPPPQATNLVALSGGYFNALGIYPNGAVMQWGGSAVPAAATNVVSVDVGQRLYQTAHNAALRSDGTVLGWGTQYPVPVDATNVMAIAAGDKSALALRDDGRVLSWGSLAAPADLTNAVAIEAGPNHGLAIVRDPYIPVPPPRMGIQPEGASLHTGDSFVLRATLVGAIPARYSWRFNGERVPSLNAPWLYLTNVHPREAGDYVMVASNEFGCVTSAVATVTVAIPEPVLHSLSMTTNGFSFTFKSIDDVLYVTEYSGAVASGPWIELERRFGNGGIEVVADPDIGAAGRFYQVRALYAPPPMLGTATWTGSAVSFSVPTVAGARYVVEYKDDLDEPAWLELEERFGTGEVLQIIDPEPLPLSRFYRVRVR